MKKLSIFASGGGSNAQKIYDYFKNSNEIEIDSVVSNQSSAKVLDRAKKWGSKTVILDKASFRSTDELSDYLIARGTDLIVLAGFLWLVPGSLLKSFPNKIVNIHPALLPKFGGKGMHGMHVHQAVFDAKEKESGITIHYINEEYDKGDVIFQAKCNVEGLSPELIAQKVLELEHYHFPREIEKLLF